MTPPTKVTKEALLAKIAAVDYVVMPDGRTTVCQLTMQNGFTVRGESSCVSVENFNKELGEKYAYEKAFDATWAFEGYLLAELRHREAYTVLGSFGWALERLNEGSRVARAGWNGKGLWVELQIPDEHSKMTLPYLYLNYPTDAQNTPGARVPWLASQTDMLAEDWEEAL